MKKNGIINAKLAGLIAGAGHFDKIAVCDCGIPIPQGMEVVDLAIVAGFPGFMQVLTHLMDELLVEEYILASELLEEEFDLPAQIENLLPNVPRKVIPHKEFKEQFDCVKLVIRTGENHHYSNVIFTCGVTF